MQKVKEKNNHARMVSFSQVANACPSDLSLIILHCKAVFLFTLQLIRRLWHITFSESILNINMPVE
jgi:hypothetical protein